MTAYDPSEERSGWTALHNCASYGHRECVQLLVRGGSDVNAREEGNWTPLHCAAHRGRTEAVRALLETPGIDVNPKSLESKETPLHRAAVSGSADTTELLLKHGAHVDAVTDCNGESPLHTAADKCDTRVLKLLVAAGADIKLESEDGRTAYDFAEYPWSPEDIIKTRRQSLALEFLRSINAPRGSWKRKARHTARYFAEKGVYMNSQGCLEKLTSQDTMVV